MKMLFELCFENNKCDITFSATYYEPKNKLWWNANSCFGMLNFIKVDVVKLALFIHHQDISNL